MRSKPREHFASINDPRAIDPLTRLILAERLRPLKILFIRTLAKMPYDRAVHQLIYVSLVDPDIEIFYEAVDRVADRRIADTAHVYVTALKNVNNIRVNRAAYALRKLADDSAIEPLIDALVTHHLVHLQRSRGSESMNLTAVRPNNAAAEQAIAKDRDNMSSTAFSNGESAKTTVVSIPNNEVLAALVQLSGGVSFGFDKDAWRRWHAAQRQQVPTFATRRD